MCTRNIKSSITSQKSYVCRSSRYSPRNSYDIAACDVACVAVCCRVLQCFADLAHLIIEYALRVMLHKSMSFRLGLTETPIWLHVKVNCCVLQCVAVCCSVLQCVAVCWIKVGHHYEFASDQRPMSLTHTDSKSSRWSELCCSVFPCVATCSVHYSTR